MKSPSEIFAELVTMARRELYRGKPDKTWFAQQRLVKKALLYPSRWLKQREVEISPERYKAIVEGIVATIVAKGNLDGVGFMSRYLLTCVQRHMEIHGDKYYQEGVAIRNRVGVFMTKLENARTVATLAQAEAELTVAKPREAPALILQPDLLPVAKVRQSTPKTKVPRKKRSDALAYKLSPAQGAEITRQISAGASYRKIVALCASWGVKTSRPHSTASAAGDVAFSIAPG